MINKIRLKWIGFIFVFSSDYEVQVTTGNSLGAGTDAKVYIKIFGTKESIAEHELDAIHKDPFERGKSVFELF